MTWPRRMLRKVSAVIFPWPAKHEREAAIAKARRSRQHSEAETRRAKGIERQLKAMASQNHFAQAIRDQIIRGHG